MTKEYRPGAVGALMDEYERAAGELARIVAALSDEAFDELRDAETKDEDCRSIRTVLNHVVRSTYGYADYIRAATGQPSTRPEPQSLDRAECLAALDAALAYTAETLEGRWRMTDEEIMAVSMKVRWGPTYDLEQLLEHAIVHILRHRRQIERFLLRAAGA
jgi:uncharacterized damage-inducible protein DinB